MCVYKIRTRVFNVGGRELWRPLEYTLLHTIKLDKDLWSIL